MNCKWVWPALAVLPLSSAQLAFAERPYGMAGCGLGSVLAGKKPKDQPMAAFFNLSSNSLSTSAAATVVPNEWFFAAVFLAPVPQNMAIVSGTSHCVTDENTSAALQETYMFENYTLLAKDMAQGGGSALDGLANVLGCEEESKSIFFQFTQKQYRRIFASPGAVAALRKLKENLALDATLSESCKNIALPASESHKL